MMAATGGRKAAIVPVVKTVMANGRKVIIAHEIILVSIVRAIIVENRQTTVPATIMVSNVPTVHGQQIMILMQNTA